MFTRNLLEHLERQHFGSPRLNDPAEYISFLKSQPRFRRLTLDDMPRFAIVFHDTRVENGLSSLGYSESDYTAIETGTTDPNLLFIVAGRNGAPDFVVNRGLPGAGGVATQTAELIALGAEFLVHVGTCGLVGHEVTSGQVIIAKASYKDAAGALICPDSDPLIRSDDELSADLAQKLTGHGRQFDSVGYTIPIFYFQPLSLIRELLTGEIFPNGPPVGYFEMEEASFFATCQLMGVAGASLVVGSDRYFLEDESVTHVFEDFDQHSAETAMLSAAIDCFRAYAIHGKRRSAKLAQSSVPTATPLVRELL
jgi:uridine phosphorylase